MKRAKCLAYFAAMAAGFLSVPAHAQAASDVGLYLAAEIGYVSPGDDKKTLDNFLTSAGGSGFSSSLSSAAIGKIIGGYRFHPNFALELAYYGTGNESYSASGGNLTTSLSANASFSGASLNIVCIAPLFPSFSGVGKVGVASTREKFDISAVGISSTGTSTTRTGLTADLGLRWDLPSRLFMTLDVARIALGDSSNYSWTTTISGGAGYRF
jgi:opacity protein-like surface antigen